MDFITLAIAMLGAVLGVLNTVVAVRQVRARLRVRVLMARISGDSLRLCVQVVNLSAFPVTLTSVGFKMRRRTGFAELGFHPEFLNGQRLPIRLEPRTTLTGFAPPGTEQCDQLAAVAAVLVKTECGCVKRGRSKALAWYIQNRPVAADAQEVRELAQDWGRIAVSPYGPPKTRMAQAPQE